MKKSKPKSRLPTKEIKIGGYYFMTFSKNNPEKKIDPTDFSLVKVIAISGNKKSFSYVVINIDQRWLECIFRKEVYPAGVPTFYLARPKEVAEAKEAAKTKYKTQVDEVVDQF